MKVVLFKKKDSSLYDYMVNVTEIKETNYEFIIHYERKVLNVPKKLFYIMISTS